MEHSGTRQELIAELLTTSRTLVGITIRAIASAPVDITVAQNRLLALLADRGAQSVGEIADYLGVNPSNATRHCDRLQRLDLVRRRRSTTDGRVVQIELTPRGLHVLKAVTQRRCEALNEVVGRLPEAEHAAVLNALKRFNAASPVRAEPAHHNPRCSGGVMVAGVSVTG